MKTYVYYTYLTGSFLECEMFQKKVVQKIKHTFNVQLLLP
jgi:hypothetical protein